MGTDHFLARVLYLFYFHGASSAYHHHHINSAQMTTTRDRCPSKSFWAKPSNYSSFPSTPFLHRFCPNRSFHFLTRLINCLFPRLDRRTNPTAYAKARTFFFLFCSIYECPYRSCMQPIRMNLQIFGISLSLIIFYFLLV